VSALSIAHLSVVLGARLVIDDVTIDFAAGSVTAIVGRSGAGKSVLMKAAAGLLPRSAGTVTLGVPPLVFVHQDPALLDDLDVAQNVALPARATGKAADPRPWLTRLGLQSVAHMRPAQLSPSQARRAALARALLLEPGVLIVDEPTTGLDPIAADDVDDALCAVVAAEHALVVITHHPRTLQRLTAIGAGVVVVEAGRLSVPRSVGAAGAVGAVGATA